MRAASNPMIAAVLALGLGAMALPAAAAATSTQPSPTPVEPSIGFIENRGQLDDVVLYYLPVAGAAIYFTRDAIVFDLMKDTRREADPSVGDAPGASPAQATIRRQGCAVWLRLDDDGASSRIEARGELTTTYSYFRGRDPAGWRSNIAAYAEIVYRNLRPGVDLVVRHDRNGLAYEFEVAAGARPGAPRFLVEGADKIVAGDDQTLRIETSAGHLTDRRLDPEAVRGLLTWTVGNGEGEGGRHAGARDDPAALLWSTFVGGNARDYGGWRSGCAVDPSGNVILTGQTLSPDFPTTPGAYDETYNVGAYDYNDVFVTKLDASGSTVLWSTFLGGVVEETGHSVVIYAGGNVVVLGETCSAGFPITPGAFDVTLNGYEAFVTKLDPTGSSLVWSTFLGGSANEEAYCLVLDEAGDLVIVGSTRSADFPTTPGAYDGTYAGGLGDVFVAKLRSSGDDLVWATFLGGDSTDDGYNVALDPAQNVLVSGRTGSTDFPATPGAFDETWNESWDRFVAKLDPTGSDLVWATYLGGTGWDAGYGLAVDGEANPVVVGAAGAADFPTTPGAYDEVFDGQSDAFALKLDASGSELLWSTFIGGSGSDGARGVVLDPSGNLLITGETHCSDFPTTPDGYDQSFNGVRDAFATVLGASGKAVLWSSFLGGSGEDFPGFLARGPGGNLVVVGSTLSSDFPTTPGAYDTSFGGVADVFVSNFNVGGSTPVEGSFSATATEPGDVRLSWSVASLAGIEGFRIYRALHEEGPFATICDDVLPPRTPGSFLDTTVWPETTFWYELRGVSADGYEEPVAAPVASVTTGGRLVAQLFAPHPNPFSSETAMVFDVPGCAHRTSLAVYNVRGQLVRRVVEDASRGRHCALWDGSDESGHRAPSGVYFVRLDVGGSVRTRKLLLIR